MEIPLFDCRISDSGLAVCSAVLQSGRLFSGDHVAAFEQEMSERLGGRAVVLLSDLTHALEMALRLSGVGCKDEVLALSYNCLSSTSAIRNIGAKPVWVDIDPSTASMDIDHVSSAITPATRAIVVYHVAGYPANTPALRTLCDKHGLVLIEDANNALASVLPGGGAAGTAGDYSVFSFYANRQINAIEGAALVCADEASAVRARKLRRFGINPLDFRDAAGEISRYSDIEEIGFSASVSNVNAALARHGLTSLNERQRIVHENAAWMVKACSKMRGIQAVQPVRNASPSYWVLLLLSNQRDQLLEKLKLSGISCSKLHQPNHIYSGFQTGAPFLPKTEEFMKSIIAVPCGWWISPQERGRIVDTVASVHPYIL